MATALSVWLTAAASSTLSTANKLYATSGGSPTTTQDYSLIGTATGYGEVCAQGTASAWGAGGSIGTPTGKGFFLDLTTLDGQDLVSGSYTGNVRFASATGTGGTLGGTLVATIYYRVYKYSSGTYTNILTMSLATQTINSTLTTYALSGSTVSNTSFATGDKLYVDIWLDVTVNANGATENIRLNRLTQDTTTFVGDTAATIVTPGYQATSGGTAVKRDALSRFRLQSGVIAHDVLSRFRLQSGATYHDAFSRFRLQSAIQNKDVLSRFRLQSGIIAHDALARFRLIAGSRTKDALARFRLQSGTTYHDTMARFRLALSGAQVKDSIGRFRLAAQVPGVTVFISNTAVLILEGTFELDDSINAISTCMFTVRDDSGVNHYHYGQPVTIVDSIKGLYYTGTISSAVEDNVRPNALNCTQIACRDLHVIPERRTYQGPEYINQYAGAIAADLLTGLAADGITAQYASRREGTQAQFTSGTLINTTATTNGGGDLELSPSGTVVSVTETGATFATGTVGNTTVINGALAQTAFNAIKITSLNGVNSAGNTYSYVKVWAGSVAIASTTYFYYTLFVVDTSPEVKIGMDLTCTDGTTLRDTGTVANGASDVQSMLPHPGTDLTGLADGQWYTRGFLLGNALSGKTVAYATIAIEGDKTGTYTGYVYNAYFAASNGGSPTTYVYNNATSITAQQLQNYGYENTRVSIAKVYSTFSQRISPAYSIDAAKISSSTLISWVTSGETSTATVNTVSPLYPNLNFNNNGSQVIVLYSLDGNAFQVCTNNAPLPSFPVGLSVASKNVYFAQILFSSTVSPEVTATLQTMTLTVSPGYNGTKTDSINIYDNSTAWLTGTFTNTTNNSGAQLLLSGTINNYNVPSGGQTLFSSAFNADRINYQTYALSVGTGSTDVRSRLDFAGQYQDFNMECDMYISSNYTIGYVWRTTNWNNANNTFAYTVTISPTQLAFGYGPNNNTPAYTSLGTVTLTLTNNSWHRVKVVQIGTNCKIYIDDVQFVNVTDSHYTATGYVGLRVFNASGATQTGYFDNFGIAPSLTGTWVSSSISLNSLGTYYSSDLYYANLSTDYSNSSVLAEYTINGGSTWVTIPNGLVSASTGLVTNPALFDSGPLPGLTPGQSLVGVSMQLRFTHTTTTASSRPVIDSVNLKILGGFSASGTRVSATLPLTAITRLGSSLVAWNSTLPTGTTLGVDTSIDGGTWTDVSGSNGGTIPGMAVQPVATFDGFSVNTSANYTSTFRSGGSAATWTYSSILSALIAFGGATALYVWNSVTGVGDCEIIWDMDESDNGGVVWRYTDANNHYECVINDASSSSGTTNKLALYKISGGVWNALASATIVFTRATYHRFKINMQAGVILAYMDGLQVATYTDASPLSAGKTGLWNDGGTARYYSLRTQPLGDIVSSHYVQMRLRLASTNPLVTPQILNTTLSAFGNTIQVGALIPKTAYNNKYLSDCFQDLIKQSSASGGQWWWSINKSKIFSMMANTGTPGPWIASDNPGDFLDAGLTITDQSDLYRNRQIVSNVLQTTSISESRVGDNVSRSWTFGYQWASAPTITVNEIAQSVGIKGVDTGKTFYYAVGDPTIVIDASVTTYTQLFTIAFSGTGQYLTNAQYDNTTEQAALAAIDGTSGIVENVEDGTGLTYMAGLALAQARVTQYGVRGKIIDAVTLHDGLQVGMLMPVFLPEHGIMDQLFLIRSIKTHLTGGANPNGQYQTFWYTIQAISGPDLGDWTQLYAKK